MKVRYGMDTLGMNPVAEWSETFDGVTYRHQLVQIGSEVLYGTSVGGGPWRTMTVRNPDRFGWLTTGLSRTKARAEFKAWVERFLAGEEVSA